ncbi:MAG: cell wall hydrolase [Rhizobiaceae bacterium]|nr:cell wall hydrolase [Rhizobiaceae bacterium]
MHRRLVRRLSQILTSGRSCASPLVVGIGIWIGFPTGLAYQDMASMIGGSEASGARWAAFVQRSVAGSVHAAEMPFLDGTVTGSAMSGSGVEAPGIGAVSFRGKSSNELTPDETRVVRADKKGRLLRIAPVAPPKAFNAGSVFQRTSLLEPSQVEAPKMAFARSEVEGKEIQIAAAFHAREERPRDPGVPAILAPLVTNETADVLATAYAPPEPDYAKTSPFETLLRDDDPNGGRFVPPLADGDHDWMKKPLPASVFSSAEQKCLATAIYFEARGESLRGQAAVAQVVLNRVRNPAYPSTICGVVYQNDNWKNRCQFSFACDGIKDRIASPSNYRIAEEIAMAVTAGKIFLPEVASSTHYYATYVSPRWARSMEKMKKIGLHIFYRTYGGGWS